MKKLSKEQSKALDIHSANLDGAFEQMREAIEHFNDTLAEAREWRSEIVGQMDDYISERSDKWVESEAGESYGAWRDEWDELDLDDAELPTFDPEALSNLRLSPSD